MPNSRILPGQERADLVSFSIKVDGQEVGVLPQVISVSVHKEVNKVPWAKILIRDGDVANGEFSISDDEIFVPGKEVEITTGYHQEETSIFKGIIVKHGVKIRQYRDPISLLEVECRDEAIKLTVGRKNKYFVEVSDKAAIEEILGVFSLANDVEDFGVEHKEIVQFYTTDWDFILSRADANGKLVIVDDGTVNIKAPDFGQSPTLSLQYGATILEFEAEMDARYQYQSIKASSWNFADQALVESQGSSPSSFVEQGNLSSSDLAGVIGLDELHLKHSGEVIDQELQKWADSINQRSLLAKICGRIKINGQPDIKPGNLIELQGVGERFNGTAFVSAIHHTFGGDGNWHTQMKIGLSPDSYYQGKEVSSPIAGGLLPGVTGLQIGRVTQIEGDPDQEHRVLVRIPVVDDTADGIWARVATLDAGSGDGAGRGSFFRPELDDEVVVGFLNDDPRDPVILGMLHSSNKPAPLEGSDDNHEKGFVTRSDMKMIWNDDVKSLTIETPAGNKVVMSEEDEGITMEDQNGNKIQMNADGIVIESAKELSLIAGTDLKAEGVNIEQKASAGFKAEGSSTTEVKSGGSLTIKGSIVQIN